MISLQQGQNRMLIPKIDMPSTMPAVIVLRLVNTTTNRIVFCQLTDLLGMTDWYEYIIDVVGASADPLTGQIAMTPRDAGEWSATLFGGATYSEAPSLLTELRTERAQYSV